MLTELAPHTSVPLLHRKNKLCLDPTLALSQLSPVYEFSTGVVIQSFETPFLVHHWKKIALLQSVRIPTTEFTKNKTGIGQLK